MTGNYRDFFGKLFQANKIKLFNELIDLLKKNFDDRIYFEIQRHKENEEKNVMARPGLYANIHAKRKRGGKMRKKGAKGAPTAANFRRAAQTVRKK